MATWLPYSYNDPTDLALAKESMLIHNKCVHNKLFALRGHKFQ